MNQPPNRPRDRRSWLRLTGMGMELATITLVLAAVGHWIDTNRGHATPYATAAGVLIGFALGMVRFVMIAQRQSGD